MTRSRGLAWILLVVWCAWIFSFQSLLATAALGSWTPDFGLILLLSLDRKLVSRDARLAAVCIAAGRIAFSTDPPLAVLAGYLGIIGLSAGLRRVFEIDHVVPRALLAGFASLGLAGFWMFCRAARLGSQGVDVVGALPWRVSMSTALVSILLLPLFFRLPGLRPLWKPQWRMGR